MLSRSFSIALLSSITIAACLSGFGWLHSGEAEHCDFVFSCDQSKWHATLNSDFKAGSRQINQLGFMLPVAQTEDSMWFVDFRGWVDDDHNDEYNIGLAYRRVLEDKIIGFYGFFDRHFSHATRNQFDQVTVGAEILGTGLDHRFNSYIPTNPGGKATGTGNLSIVGNQIFISGLEQRPYWGFDYEAGKLLKCFGKDSNEVRLFGGAYYFTNDADNYRTIAGPRVRLETRLFDVSLLGEASRVTLSGEVQWDQVRDTQAFAGIQIQIPLGKFGSAGWTGETPFGANQSYAGLSHLERRMYDPIIRDVDVVTNTSEAELANDAEDDLLFVAFDGPGIDTEINNAMINGTIIASGTMSTVGNHQLLEGQRIASGNSIQTVTGASSGIRITTKLPGQKAILNSINPLNPVIQLANRNIVDSLHINGGLNGISGGSVSSTFIINNTISGAVLPSTAATPGGIDGSGIGISGSFSGTIANNLMTTNEANGILIGTNNGTIAYNRSQSNVDDGIDILNDNNGAIISNNLNGDMDESIDVKGDNNGTINYNVSNQAGDNGIAIAGDNNGAINYNKVMNAASAGIELEQNNTGTVDYNIANGNLFGVLQEGFGIFENSGSISFNTTDNNLVGGIVVEANTGTIEGNSASSNGEVGIAVLFNDADGVITNNTSSNNGLEGFFTFVNLGTITENVATNNFDVGFFLGANVGLFSGNTANMNFDGIVIEDNFDTISNNTASNNTDIGFILDTNDGVFSGNTANMNFAGFDVIDNLNIFSNNTANHNIDFGFGLDPLFGGPLIANSGLFNSNTATANGAPAFRLKTFLAARLTVRTSAPITALQT